jgi:hypothetical protein
MRNFAMSHADTLEAETMADAFKSGYTRNQIVRSVALALALHGALVAGLLLLGSEKKPSEKAAAAKTAKDAKESSSVESSAKTPPKDGSKADDLTGAPTTTTAKSKDDAAKKEAAKNIDTAKPNEIPASPDADIDNILKAK